MGRRFNDHPQIVLEWTPNRDLGSESADSWISGCLNLAASNGPISGDLQILQSNVSMSVLTGHSSARADTALPLLISVNSPEPTGSLRLVSADPRVPLDIQYRYLSTPGDSLLIREAVRVAVDLLSTKAFSAVGIGPRDLDRQTVTSLVTGSLPR